MRRSSLLTVAVVGLLICLLGGTGLFAALTDTADLGPNRISSAPLAGSADLQLAYRVPAPGDPSQSVCGDYQENLTAQYFIDAGNLVSGPSGPSNMVCIRNVGSQTLGTTVHVTGLTDLDTDCTGDEAAVGDTTCGAGQEGELSSALQAHFYPTDCVTGNALAPNVASIVATMVGTPLDLPLNLAPSAEVCYDIAVVEPGGLGSTVHQLVQSDSAEWTFQFTGTAP